MLDSLATKSFSLYNSGTISAKENMKIDEELFSNFSSSSKAIFRVYAWEKSYTYGISQDIKKIKNHPELLAYKDNYAKRITGGGILFHGNDISYSLVIPLSYVKNLSVKKSYEIVCSFLLVFYKKLGLNPIYAKDSADINLSKSEYCQKGYEPYDILIDGLKFGGNAQRRTKSLLFQHGSISLNNSCQTAYNSLEDLDIKLSYDEAKELLIQSFEETFSVSFVKNA